MITKRRCFQAHLSISLILLLASPMFAFAQGRKNRAERANSTAVDDEIVRAMIAKNLLSLAYVDKRGGASRIVDVTILDLNGDRRPEYLVSCACEVMDSNYVFRRTNKELVIIYWGTQRETITPLRTSTRGWRDLRSRIYRSIDGASMTNRLRWNGSEYRY